MLADAPPIARVRRVLLSATLALASLAWPAAARADIVADFSMDLEDFKAYGAYTIGYHEWSYDTSGAVVPPWARQFLRLPAGISIRPQFLKKRFFCDIEKLRFSRRLQTCRNAQIGEGAARARVFDAADSTPLFDEPIPAHIHLFLTKPAKGAAFSFVIYAIPDANAPVVRSIPAVRETRVILPANVFDDPTPDGLFGYRVELPTTLGGLTFSDERVDTSVSGLTITKRVRKCVTPGGRSRAARCQSRRTRVKRTFWSTQPTCPASGKLSFQAFYSFLGLAPKTITHEIPCPRSPR